MTKLLEKALEKISNLPQEEQDAIASQILAELEDEAAWAKRIAAHGSKLRHLADEALAEHRQGKTRPLDDLS
jgi:DNA-binding protein H-NS